MKKIAKLAVALSLIALSVTSPFVSTVDANAAAGTGYTKASDVVYATHQASVGSRTKTIVSNWGARNETCVFLTSYATDYYSGNNTYDVWATQKSPSSTTKSNAHTTTLFWAYLHAFATV